MTYFLKIPPRNKIAKNTTDRIFTEIKISHVFFEIAQDVISELNIDVGDPHDSPTQRVWLRQ